jgi:hypothetical protein
MSARYANHIGGKSMYLFQTSSKPVPNTFKIKKLTTLRGIGAGRC